jgi:predicted membrane chloride channel (bestrophin family)
MIKFIIKHLSKRSLILYKVIPYIILIIVVKLILHQYGFELITINTIFSGLIGATVFLMGFLLSGVLSDYKESEKIPGEISAILTTMSDEMEIICKSKNSPIPLESLKYLSDLAVAIKNWFYKKEKTYSLFQKITGLNDYFIKFESLTQANFITRLKQEQNNLRKLIIRIHTIRETDFISSGYFIASTTTIFLLGGLVLSKIEPFYESLFFVGVVSYLLIFLIFLIRDLDNPFGYYENSSSEDVSLKPLDDVTDHINRLLDTLSGVVTGSNKK